MKREMEQIGLVPAKSIEERIYRKRKEINSELPSLEDTRKETVNQRTATEWVKAVWRKEKRMERKKEMEKV